MDFDRQPPVWVFLLIGGAIFVLLSCGGCCGLPLLSNMRRGRRF